MALASQGPGIHFLSKDYLLGGRFHSGALFPSCPVHRPSLPSMSLCLPSVSPSHHPSSSNKSQLCICPKLAKDERERKTKDLSGRWPLIPGVVTGGFRDEMTCSVHIPLPHFSSNADIALNEPEFSLKWSPSSFCPRLALWGAIEKPGLGMKIP